MFEKHVEATATSRLQSVELVAEYTGWTTDADLAVRKEFVNSHGLGIERLIATPEWTKRPVLMIERVLSTSPASWNVLNHPDGRQHYPGENVCGAVRKSCRRSSTRR